MPGSCGLTNRFRPRPGVRLCRQQRDPCTRKDKEGYTFTVRSEYRSYGCRGQGDHPHIYQCRQPQFVRAEKMEDAVWQKLVEAVSDPDVLRQACADQQAQEVQALEEGEVIIAKRRRQLAKVTEERQRAIDLMLDGVITRDDLQVRLARVDKDVAMWQKELDDLERAVERQTRSEETAQALERYCQDIRPILAVATPQERREILMTVADKIWLTGDGEIRIEGIIPAFREHPTATPEGGGGGRLLGEPE